MQNNSIDFSTVLASAVHDMKNSLCLLLQSIENLNNTLSTEDPHVTAELASAHYEASRLNTGLVQLLSLYRADREHLPLHIDECFIEDLFDEILGSNQHYIKHKNTHLDVSLQDNLVWYLDADLVKLLLTDMLVNALRYTNAAIKLSAEEENGMLTLKVEDDGDGYPSKMLEANNTSMHAFNISQGRTGLGLFFARMIAEAHTRDGHKGSITLSNGGSLGGSVFCLKLP